MRGLEKPRSVLLAALFLISIMSPLFNPATAYQTTYSGDDPIGSNETQSDLQVNISTAGFNLPANATPTDGWLNLSTPWDMDGGNGTWFEAGVFAQNFTLGSNNLTSTSHFGQSLSLAPDSDVGWVDDLEDLSLQFKGFSRSSHLWSVRDMNLSSGNGSMPSTAPQGIFIAAVTAAGGLPPGTVEWLQSPDIELPNVVHNLSLHFEHWLNVDVDDGAWVEARLDNGVWQQVEPVDGYNHSLSNGTQAFVGYNATSWSHVEFPLDAQLGISELRNSSTISFRFQIVTMNHSQERPGWFIDALNLSNSGEPTNSWFHGNLNGAYAANADAAITLKANTTGMSHPLEFELWVDWDLEGGVSDNLLIEISLDGSNWTPLSLPPGIPGTGQFIDGIWYYAESGDFKQILLPILSGFANRSEVWIRLHVQTDGQVNGGYGISGWEGVYVDDPMIHSNRMTASHSWILLDNFTSNNSVTPYSPSNVTQQWKHVTDHGHNGPTWSAIGFEDSPLWPDGWEVEVESGTRGWEFGEYPGYGPMPGFPSGSTGAGTELSGKYQPNMWTHLVSPLMSIPDNASARLTFSHWMCAENNWDGGAVYLSTDDGVTWNHFGQNLSSFYDTNSTVNPQSPFYMKGLFDGSRTQGGCFNTHPFITKRADVSALAGQDVRFRFSFYSDTYIEEWGWYLDDIGIEVDYFESEGNWTSPLIEADDWGYGLLDVRATIPAETWVRASALSATGDVLLENQSLPLNLQSLNWSAHPSIKVRLHLGTSDPYLTPVIDKITLGADVHLTKETIAEGWYVEPAGIAFDAPVWNQSNQRWQVGGVNKSYLRLVFQEHRPIKDFRITCICSGVHIGASGNFNQFISAPTTLSASRSGAMGWINIHLTIHGSGWIESFDLRPRYHGFTADASIDVGADDDEEWAWPERMSHIGHHGLQSVMSHADITTDGQTNRVILDSQSASFEIEDALLNLSMLVPVDAQVNSYQLSIETTFLGQNQSNASLSQQWDGTDIGQQQQPGSGINWWSMQMFGPTQNLSLPQTVEFQEFRYLFNTTGKWRIEIHRMMFIYDLKENISLETQKMETIIAEQAILQNSSMVDIPIAFTAERGRIAIEGAVIWQHLISNSILSAPQAMVPDGSTYRAVTRHRHLYDEQFTVYELRMSPSRDPEDAQVVMKIVDPHSQSPIYEQPVGQGYVVWDIENTTITYLGDEWEIQWVWSTTWLWDDQAIINFMAEAGDTAGTILGPAVKTVGLSAGNAVENDLELVNIEVKDQFDRDLTDVLDPHHPWPVSAGSDVSIEGQVRFQGSVDLWVSEGQAKVELLLEQGDFRHSQILEVGLNGAWSSTFTLPPPSADLSALVMMNLTANVASAGPSNLPDGLVEDATTGIRGAGFLWDAESPQLGVLYALTPGGDQPADGHVWDQEIPLSLGLEVKDGIALGNELTLHYWRQGLDDTDADGIAQLNEYKPLLVQLNLGSNELIEFPFIDVSALSSGSVVSLFITTKDLAGILLLNGGVAGLEYDLATVTIMIDHQTVIEPSDLSMALIGDDHLLPGQEHGFSFQIKDANGIASLDIITIDLTGGDGTCRVDWRPWSVENPSTWDDECFIEAPTFSVEEQLPGEYSVVMEFILSWSAITFLGEENHTPSFSVEDQGEDLGLGLENLQWLQWTFYEKLEVVLTYWQDLVPSNGSLVGDNLYLTYGDIIDVEWEIQHSDTGLKALRIPQGCESLAKVLGGLSQMETLEEIDGNKSGGARFGFQPEDFPNGMGNLVINIIGLEDYSTTSLDVTIRLDDNAPRITFQITSLMRVRSDSLDGLQVLFTVEDDVGLPAEDMTLHWIFQRNGLVITGASGELEVDYVSPGIYHDVLNLSSALEGIQLRGSDDLIVWVEGRDLSGNKMTGPGSEFEPRRPIWDYIAFSPEVVYISVNPRLPKLGEVIIIDVQVQNTGTLSGNTTLHLYKQVDGVLLELDSSAEFRLLSGLSAQISFEHEVAEMGDQQLYVVLEGDESMVPVPLGIVRETLAEEQSTGLSIEWTLGFLFLAIGMFVVLMMIRTRADQHLEEEYEQFDERRSLQVVVAPPRPVELDSAHEEE